MIGAIRTMLIKHDCVSIRAISWASKKLRTHNNPVFRPQSIQMKIPLMNSQRSFCASYNQNIISVLITNSHRLENPYPTQSHRRPPRLQPKSQPIYSSRAVTEAVDTNHWYCARHYNPKSMQAWQSSRIARLTIIPKEFPRKKTSHIESDRVEKAHDSQQNCAYNESRSTSVFWVREIRRHPWWRRKCWVILPQARLQSPGRHVRLQPWARIRSKGFWPMGKQLKHLVSRNKLKKKERNGWVKTGWGQTLAL